MILKRLSDYIKTQQRVEEGTLLKEFRLNKNGLAPMVEVLISTGHVQKTIQNRGNKMPPQVFYSWYQQKCIPITTMI